MIFDYRLSIFDLCTTEHIFSINDDTYDGKSETLIVGIKSQITNHKSLITNPVGVIGYIGV